MQAARRTGRRAIIYAGWAGLALTEGEPGCLVIGEANQQRLFRRVAAVVHHGGAGTTTTAALAGVPQVVIPQAYDQRYWAQRVRDLGIGFAHPPGTPDADSLTTAVQHASSLASRPAPGPSAGPCKPTVHGPPPLTWSRGLQIQPGHEWRHDEQGHGEGLALAADPEADSHELIRVHGARENNLKDVSVEIPKRRLTVFTGVSGSGKSSLVFDTIAAESQRLINETYSTFVQGFMPALARPEVDVLEGLTTAIIVDQQRIGSDPRSTVGTATDANAMLRILFSRVGQPHIGLPKAFSFNIASISGAGAVEFERGGKTVKERRSFTVTGGMCPRCEGRGAVSDIDLTQLYDDSKSLNEGAITVPGYTGEAGTPGCTPSRASTTRTSRSASSPRRNCTTSSTTSRSG